MTKLSPFHNIESSPILSGIPAYHANSHLSNFMNKYKEKDKDNEFIPQLEKIVQTVLALEVKKCPRYIVLCGHVGSGKTHFLVGLYKALCQKLGYAQGDGAFFTTFTYLAEEIIDLFSQNIALRPALTAYLQPRWIFIDDFTSGERIYKQNSLEFNIFRDILIDRFENNLTLVTTCNLTQMDFMKRMDVLFGNYITSRLSSSLVVEFPNIDLRKVYV